MKRKMRLKHLQKSNAQLIAALDQAHLEIISFINEGKFDRKIVWNCGYILNAIAFAKHEPLIEETPHGWDEIYDED